jgi:hypothetical protein
MVWCLVKPRDINMCRVAGELWIFSFTIMSRMTLVHCASYPLGTGEFLGGKVGGLKFTTYLTEIAWSFTSIFLICLPDMLLCTEETSLCFVMRNGFWGYRILVEKPVRKWSLGRPRRKWEDNNKMDLSEVCCEDGKWMELAQDHVKWWASVLGVLNLWLCYQIKFSGVFCWQ